MNSLARKPKSKRDPFIVAVQVAKKNLNLDDDDYRAVLKRIADVKSSTKVPYNLRQKVLDEFRRLGARNITVSRSGVRLDGPYATKLQALWIGAYNLGIIREKSDAALLKFVERMTGISHTRWLHQPKDANKAIEALKKWMERESSVNFGAGRTDDPAFTKMPQFRIVKAQINLLNTLGAKIISRTSDHSIEIEGHNFGPTIMNGPDSMAPSAWIKLMNNLGDIIRQLKYKKAAG